MYRNVSFMESFTFFPHLVTRLKKLVSIKIFKQSTVNRN